MCKEIDLKNATSKNGFDAVFLRLLIYYRFNYQFLTDLTNIVADCSNMVESNQIESSERYVNSFDDCLYFDSDHSHKKYHRRCCIACEKGQWLDEYSNSCIDCEKGQKCPSTILSPQNCEPGYFQPKSKQTACISCPTGKACPTSGMIGFMDCPAGYNCQNPDAIYECPGGTFSDGSATNCLTCSLGNFCQNGTIHKCLPGTAANVPGLNQCLNCPSGMNCANPIEPVKCPDGQYPAESKIVCLICSPGNYCSSGMIRQCVPGKDCSEEGQYEVSLTSICDIHK